MVETLTANKNYLQPTGFRVIIDRENYPNLEFFAQSVNHPDVSVTAPSMPYPRIGNISLPGDTVEYSELSIQFLLDEDMTSYLELYNWFESMVNEEFVGPGSRSARNGAKVPTQADISVAILSSHNNQNKRILYKGCSPTSLSGLQLTSIATSVEYLTFDVGFTFTGFEFKA
tara:strand:+ start:557 stop:1072 length:516 start_codon:yes stop_codon:yes gene_type:complete